MWTVRSAVYERPNRLKFSILALGLPERLNWGLKKTLTDVSSQFSGEEQISNLKRLLW